MRSVKQIGITQNVDWSQLSPTKRATIYLPELYKKANPQFPWVQQIKNLGKVLTTPSIGVQNFGLDNANGEYIFHIGDMISPTSNDKELPPRKGKSMFRVETLIGHGSFGQVLRCLNLADHSSVAVKVIKNQPAYTKQAQLEKQILQMIKQADPNDEKHCLGFIESFMFHDHVCIVTELLGDDLYSLIKEGKYRGFSLDLTSSVVSQLLEVCAMISGMGIIHCDLKPENILVDRCLPAVKVIDFGSSVFEKKTLYSYIQSRYYRSPEVIVGTKYTSQIDMWSIGCIAAELFLGRPIFPGSSEYDQLARITQMIGHIPQEMICIGRNRRKYFVEENISGSTQTQWRLMIPQEYQATNDKAKPHKNHLFVKETVERTIDAYAQQLLRENELSQRGRADRRPFIDFLNRILVIDPRHRMTPRQALSHPFITGAPFTDRWVPPLDLQFSVHSGEPDQRTAPTEPDNSKSKRKHFSFRNPFTEVLAKITAPFTRRDSGSKDPQQSSSQSRQPPTAPPSTSDPPLPPPPDPTLPDQPPSTTTTDPPLPLPDATNTLPPDPDTPHNPSTATHQHPPVLLPPPPLSHAAQYQPPQPPPPMPKD
ncbi:putative serine/threonine protein kinase [Blattamonas nauphoetae]|uniref:Serine/threonine protein kinase n=1 Tax=Blattamonas nauphoetae TaxID=2049346 RepID=A0ABQ9Y652_9EUKA|nr:putative serine/threonine protein kinase [Blattamonas nauphoetae]